MLKKVISGGQTGVDQAALRAARRVGLQTGGYAPKGWKTLTGPQPELLRGFGLAEYTATGYAARTRANVRESEATVRIARNFQSAGEICTQNAIRSYRKPSFDVWAERSNEGTEATLVRFLEENRVRILNVAGNSEETASGIGTFAEEFLVCVFTKVRVASTMACVYCGRWLSEAERRTASTIFSRHGNGGACGSALAHEACHRGPCPKCGTKGARNPYGDCVACGKELEG